MGNQTSNFTCISSEGEPMSPELVSLTFPEFKEFLIQLQTDSKGIETGKVLAYSHLKKYKYDTVLHHQRQDALIYVCKKVKENSYIFTVYACTNFEYNINLENLKDILLGLGLEGERVISLLQKFKEINK